MEVSKSDLTSAIKYLEDAAKLGLDMNMICDFIDVDEDVEDDDDDDELFSIINAKRG